jgi:hypothetical protein
VLTENPEKTARLDIIGKFGFGLKDALGTLYRRGVQIEIHSAYGFYYVIKRDKQGLEGVETLHVAQEAAQDASMQGTAIFLSGLSDQDMTIAKNMFMSLSDPTSEVLDSLPNGQIIRYTGRKAPIMVNGLQVGEEDRFLFGYNLISPAPTLIRALNRERRHVGRTAYVAQVKELLLKSDNQAVAKALAEDFTRKPTHEELSWLPVQEHAVRLLNRAKKYIFYKEGDAFLQPALLDEARGEGLTPLELPKKLWNKILGSGDYQQSPILTLEEYARQRNANFQPEFVSIQDLTADEQAVWQTRKKIFESIGGRPAQIREVHIAQKIVLEEKSPEEVVGLWDERNQRIVIRRDQLRSVRSFAGVLLHEIAHATSGRGDCDRGFEHELTNLLGKVADAMIKANPAAH